jgi:predicted nuclease with RNAse H fold
MANANPPGLVVGIDVSRARGCAWAALDGEYRGVVAGWIDPSSDDQYTVNAIGCMLAELGQPVKAVGIDAPRMPLKEPRRFRWKDGRWRKHSVGCVGRHCEIIVSTLGIATPQWTGTKEESPAWMQLGFELFAELGQRFLTMEVFPTASYRMFADSQLPSRMEVNLADFARGPKDVLDAYVSAVTVREFMAGRGCEIGGGDDLGTIVLPRPVSYRHAGILNWPQNALLAKAP